MPSQLDLDQGGTQRQTQRLYMGPSIGWRELPDMWVLRVVAGGTTIILPGTNTILVNFNGAVTLQLPSFKQSAAGAQAVPNSFAIIPVSIVDEGGFAATFPITILTAVGELISGFSTFTLSGAFGSYVIRPNIINGGGTLMQ